MTNALQAFDMSHIFPSLVLGKYEKLSSVSDVVEHSLNLVVTPHSIYV